MQIKYIFPQFREFIATFSCILAYISYLELVIPSYSQKLSFILRSNYLRSLMEIYRPNFVQISSKLHFAAMINNFTLHLGLYYTLPIWEI